jgi:riboflavin kinase
MTLTNKSSNKQLGIPTANIDPSTLLFSTSPDLPNGVYYGLVSLPLSIPASPTIPAFPGGKTPSQHPLIPTSYPPPIPSKSSTLFHAVLSLGHNPFYSNQTRSIEVHIMHSFPPESFDLYGLELRVLVLGFIRPEYDYDSLEELVEDIWVDVGVGVNSLSRTGNMGVLEGEGGEWLRGVGSDKKEGEGGECVRATEEGTGDL